MSRASLAPDAWTMAPEPIRDWKHRPWPDRMGHWRKTTDRPITGAHVLMSTCLEHLATMSRRDSNQHKPPRSNRRPKTDPRVGGSRSRPPSPSIPEVRSKQSHEHDRDRRGPERRPDRQSGPGKLERVQKVLAHAGLGSRRSCEELIRQGRVSVDGQVIRELGTRVDPSRARIAVDGEAIRPESMVYYAVNKPRGYVSTNVDPSGRPRVVDLLPEIPERVYTVGRLDEESTGLMILTNDGELANRLAHPRYGVEKVYRALIAGAPDQEVLAKLTAGVWLSDGKVRAKRARLVGRQGQANVLELVLAEGKNREIRRMLAKLGHKVMSLNRVAVGPVSVKGLSSGEYRPLSRHEVDLLWKVANGAELSLPRFLDGDSSRRARRNSTQKPRPGDGRGRRDRSGSPQGRHGDSRHEPGPLSSSKQSRPTTPPHPTQSQPRPSRRPDSDSRRAPSSHEPSARKPPHAERSSGAPGKKAASTPKHTAGGSRHSLSPPSSRRIIGLEPQSRALPSPKLERERARKRPPPRSRRPFPTPPVKRRTSSIKPPGTAGENA